MFTVNQAANTPKRRAFDRRKSAYPDLFSYRKNSSVSVEWRKLFQLEREEKSRNLSADYTDSHTNINLL